MPVRLSELELTRPLDIEEIAISYSKNKTKVIDDFKPIDYKACVEIFNIAK